MIDKNIKFQLTLLIDTELLLIVSLQMKKDYNKYSAGQFVAFDLTFNLFNYPHSNEQRCKLGCFMGLSKTRRLTPFGLVVTVDETKDRYTQIFRTFFLLMDGKKASMLHHRRVFSYKI